MEPVFGTRRVVRNDGEPPRLSFLELTELVVAAQIRQSAGVSLDKVRRAHEYARIHWQIEYPFAHLNLGILGGEIIHAFEAHEGGRTGIAISSGGTWVLPQMVEEAIALFEFDQDDKMAARWYPAGRFCQNSGLYPDFGQEREEKLPPFRI